MELLERHGGLIAELIASSDEEGALPLHATLAAAELAAALDSPPPASFERLRPLAEGFDGLPERPLPPVAATLRPYQRVGYRWMRFLMDAGLGGVLADDDPSERMPNDDSEAAAVET